MCGRFTLHSALNRLLQQFALQAGPELASRYNIAPTQRVPIVRVSPASGQREMVLMRWGLVPSWAKDISIGNRLINARAETVASKPSFRSAFKRRRCLVPTDGYYEWQKIGAKKQPFLLHFQDDSPFAFAGLWETWHADQSDALQTFTIITTEANEATAHIHDRMPVILDRDDYELWLDPEFAGAEPLQSLLRPYDEDDLQVDPVSTYVNNPRHEDQRCIEPSRELF